MQDLTPFAPCSGGIRSATAASMLMRAGFKKVEHVADGGVPALGQEGIALVRDDVRQV